MTGERKTLRPPRIRRPFVAARNAVLDALAASADRPALLEVLGGSLGLPLRLLGLEAAELPAAGPAVGGWCLHLRGAAGCELVLRIDDILAGVLAAGVLGTEPWTLPADGGGEVLAGVLSVQALRGLAALAASGRPLQLLELHRAVAEPRAPEGSVALALRLQAGEQVGRATAWVEPQAGAERAPVLPGWLGAIPVETALVVARGTLRRAELCALRIGDAVTFDETPAAGTAAAEAAWLEAAGTDRGPRWLCRPTGADHWTIVGAAPVRGVGRTSMGAMDGSDRTEVTAGTEAATPIDAVPIEVTAVAGRATLTVRALAALAPGAVVALGRSPGGTVDLSANGVPFARGRLVDLDGELAVEVTELRAGATPLSRS